MNINLFFQPSNVNVQEIPASDSQPTDPSGHGTDTVKSSSNELVCIFFLIIIQIVYKNNILIYLKYICIEQF